MGIELTKSGDIVVTGNGIQFYRFLVVTKALSLEVNAGIKMPQQPAQAARSILLANGIKPSATKRKLLEQMENLLESLKASANE